MDRTGKTLDDGSPFHAGERAVQERLGVRERIEPWARKVVRPYLPEEHRAFYAQLPFVVAAARDGQGRPWATLLTGPPGFITAPDERSLELAVAPGPGDALAGQLGPGAELGLLGIELHTRRRNRVNGTVEGQRGGVLRLAVGQTFGNCPQYITERQWREAAPAELGGAVETSDRLDARARAFVEAADTFFIASGSQHGAPGDATRGMDASHRGGPPGFVAVRSERRLVFPDYAGNNHFNTIGNLVLDPRVGLVFVDFEGGHVLQLTGRATIDWDSPEVARHPGARRLVVVDIERVVYRQAALPLRWSTADEAALALRLAARQRESDDVVSFEFEPVSGAAPPGYEAGQHLPIEVRVPGRDAPLRRTYSLSRGPGGERLRISVKRVPGGIVSGHLHERLAVGDTIRAAAPGGDFTLACGARPIVLISAGIGLTPVLAMLDHLVASGDARPVHFVHGARDGRHHPLRREVDRLIREHGRAHRTVVYSRPGADDREGVEFDRAGRIDRALLAERLPERNVDVYLCGPAPFMAAVSSALEALGVAPSRVHTETF